MLSGRPFHPSGQRESMENGHAGYVLERSWLGDRARHIDRLTLGQLNADFDLTVPMMVEFCHHCLLQLLRCLSSDPDWPEQGQKNVPVLLNEIIPRQLRALNQGR